MNCRLDFVRQCNDALEGHRKKRFPFWGTAIALILSATSLLALWFGNRIQLSDVRRAWEAADQRTVLLVLIFSCTFHVFIGGHKLYYVLRLMGSPISLGEALKLRLGAGPVRFVLPVNLGEVVQLFYLSSQRHLSVGKASGFTVFDKAINLFGSFFWLLFALGLIMANSGHDNRLGSFQSQLLFLLLFAIAYFVILFFTPLHRKALVLSRCLPTRLAVFLQAFLSPVIEINPSRKLLLIAYGIIFQTRPLIVFAVLLKAFDVSISLGQILAYGNLILLAGAIPGPISGIGPREAAVVELLKSQGNSPALLMNIGILMTLCGNLIPMFIGLPLTPWFLRRIRLQHGPSSQS
jgi:hypothetical protein